MSRASRSSSLAGWGGQSVHAVELLDEDLAEVAREAPLTRGLGRAYGDSALPPAGEPVVAGSRLADRILELDVDADPPRLRAEAGLSLDALAPHLLRRRLFPPVVPGTRYVTLGGMVAADIHGKNHHVAGTIGRHVRSLRLLGADGRIVDCSREAEPDLFRATLGGMGLTGHILEMELELERIPSLWILEETVRVDGIDAFLAELSSSAKIWPFTVGWIDCTKGGAGLGRGGMIRGRWATAEEAPAEPPRPRRGPAVPFTFPGWALNDLTVGLFNAVYSRRFPRRPRRRLVSPEPFFWPLDAIRHWNRIYGHRGFTQLQCVLPEHDRPGATRRFLEAQARHGGASFLCVIKDCGEEGEGLLSFPRRGVSVALDLPIRPDTTEHVRAMGDLVAEEGGRVYLAKDAFLRADQFERMEPRLEAFRRVRDRWDPERRLRSAQSVRLLGDPA